MFDVEQCKKDGWRCEYRHSAQGEWKNGEYMGLCRSGRFLIGNDMAFDAANVRNIQKPKKPIRKTEVVNVPANTFTSGYLGVYALTVPLIANKEGFPEVDHSDAILEVLEHIKSSCLESGRWMAYEMVLNKIHSIRTERGDE